MKFEELPLSCSRRSIQSICDCADLVHDNEGYEKTESLVTEIPSEFEDHNGVFAVKRSELDQYLSHYLPTVLRWSIHRSRFIQNDRIEKVNFGKSKGLGFDRVLIIPTTKYVQFLKKDNTVFNVKDAKTEETKNEVICSSANFRLPPFTGISGGCPSCKSSSPLSTRWRAKILAKVTAVPLT